VSALEGEGATPGALEQSLSRYSDRSFAVSARSVVLALCVRLLVIVRPPAVRVWAR
jgi:hypothetical protein